MKMSVNTAVTIIREYADKDIEWEGLMEVRSWVKDLDLVKGAIARHCGVLGKKDLRDAIDRLKEDSFFAKEEFWTYIYQNQVEWRGAELDRKIIQDLIDQAK